MTSKNVHATEMLNLGSTDSVLDPNWPFKEVQFMALDNHLKKVRYTSLFFIFRMNF